MANPFKKENKKLLQQQQLPYGKRGQVEMSNLDSHGSDFGL